MNSGKASERLDSCREWRANAVMDLDLSYPAISDLRRRARRRIPHFAFEYLDSATGAELQAQRNRDALDAVLFMPDILKGPQQPVFETSFLGQTYTRPFGIAPVGMSGLMWPGMEAILARYAQEARIPYGLSTVATRLPEEIGPLAGDMGWFQLYCPADPEIRRDMLRRARKAGFTKLVFTVDVPDDSRRERQRRAKLTLPPKITPRVIWEVLTHPLWSLGTLQTGAPRLRLPESYVDTTQARSSLHHAGHIIRGTPDWDTLSALREEWPGDLIVKGVLCTDAAQRLVKAGVDALWVSNHTGRQFEPGPASIHMLPKIRAAVGPDVPLLFDSGIASGMDILRALALGADFVMLGRAWHYAVAALGSAGPAHLTHILSEDMKLNMAQIGVERFEQLSERLI
ncbi:L-lactate dehydrogenase [cytochrome] [Pelagimonas phthalicica]|uniref:L-lactate dehydrogenase [cytochrome] n=2 Tax=Pelagimonas phthalicica TaxID=1037362 RepID=A0A238JGS9_9RHOB|nr:L-lactate dehydrogenase (cytochrome) [Pelagimonas phthalicica]SMX29006.1 L-lactate dehydrogenase [cytochrome] [Pelagimonas phthalicica]